MFFKIIYLFMIFSININFLYLAPSMAATIKQGQEIKKIYQPEQITSELDPVLYMCISNDSKKIVYSSGTEGNTDLWIKYLDPSKITPPEKLTDHPLDEISPVFSPDNRFIAYTGTSYDVKGDIFLLDLENKNQKPLRLTGKETEDGSPCFSRQGNILYFHQKGKDDYHHRLVSIDLNDKAYKVKLLNINRDSAFPAVSPDGLKIAFVSYQDDPAGDIFVMDLNTEKIVRLTCEPYMDFMPAWSYDGKYLYFSSIRTDTDKNKIIDTRDNSSIYRIEADKINQASNPFAFPLTSSSYPALSPCLSKSRLFFLSEKSGKTNCMALPVQGEIGVCRSASDQVNLSRSIAEKIPYDPYLTILAWYRVLENFNNDPNAGAVAGYEISRIYQDMGDMENALHGFNIVTDMYGSVQPYAGFSLIHQTVINTNYQINNTLSPDNKQKILAQSLGQIKQLSEIKAGNIDKTNQIKAAAMIMYAKLLHEQGRDSGSINKALKTLEDIIKIKPLDQKLAAEAMLLKADILNQAGFGHQVLPAYMQVIKTYPKGGKWTDKAVEQIINLSLNQGLSSRENEIYNEKIKALRKIAGENKDQYPVLAMGALNRIGDIYYKNNEWAMAKNAYQQVIESFSSARIQKAKAVFSLAEILYKQEQFRQALDLYESDINESSMGQGAYDDNLYRLARKAYIKNLLVQGNFFIR
ncbi:tetratricopeptide repeat protein [Desulfonema limicola]|uniref:tetratricopeptide repeat protein n=1 Tax=Desulfonema limicola TaxID=45656 RepID=UPI001A9B381B|nr:tetratricopeptide repeat protein [Desulfonema limicola]